MIVVIIFWDNLQDDIILSLDHIHYHRKEILAFDDNYKYTLIYIYIYIYK